MIRTYLIFAATLLGVGCQNYQANLQQGTELTDRKVSQLKKNLTQEEVAEVLGSPTLVPVVDKSVWHYTYWTLPGNKRNTDPHYKSLTLYFNKNRLISYRGNWDIKNLPNALETKTADETKSNSKQT